MPWQPAGLCSCRTFPVVRERDEYKSQLHLIAIVLKAHSITITGLLYSWCGVYMIENGGCARAGDWSQLLQLKCSVWCKPRRPSILRGLFQAPLNCSPQHWLKRNGCCFMKRKVSDRQQRFLSLCGEFISCFINSASLPAVKGCTFSSSPLLLALWLLLLKESHSPTRTLTLSCSRHFTPVWASYMVFYYGLDNGRVWSK